MTTFPLDIPEDQISAVHALEGRTLQTGWRVIEKAKVKPGSTGGNFSVCYIVERDGEFGFLKALNILSFAKDDDPDLLKAMQIGLNTFEYEKAILEKCNEKNLSKVSRLIEANQENISGFIIANVFYMIFEKAEGDVRNHLSFTNKIDTAWKLRSLHNIATGIKQLHSVEISHQDIKPSNIFVFEGIVSKVGDLGRSLCEALSSPHSALNFSGDKRYAPPEVFHGYVLPNWKDKVFAIDCYLLGSMAAFYFTGQSMTSLLSQKLNQSINILTYDFEAALPYWLVAFDEVIKVIEEHTKEVEDQERLVEAIRMLCSPDPRARGHLRNIKEVGSNYQLTRFVEIFNLLARKAEYALKG